ncbi:ABC transporter permease [Haliangium sp.]|uniref:ABC transporter permease n=1 Tax=Haliangium sp. TaxID=2663208 RepID=UPI003D0F1747
MSARIFAIALNTFREASRRRVLYGIVVAAVGLNLFGLVLGEMSLGEEERVARDLGMAGVSLFGCITAIALGVSLLYNEVQRRTIHTILAKPLHRAEFVLGKYLGMAATLTILVVLFSAVMAALLALQGVGFTAAIVKALVLAYTEVLVVAAIAIFFSAVSSPFLSGMFSFALFFLGRVTPEMRILVDHVDSPGLTYGLRAALFLVPDLHLFAVSGSSVDGVYVSVHDRFVDWSYVAGACGYGVLYIATLVLLAIAVFSRRDLT